MHLFITIHHYINLPRYQTFMEHKQVKSIKIEGVAFLVRDMPTHALLSIIKIPQRVLNLQMLILK